MNTTVETITPEKATEYLEGNTLNRPIRQSHVDFLVSEMKGGRWKLNGATIVFNGKQLIDGQHRLWAVVTSGVAIQSAVVRGVEEDAFSTIDTGRPRTGGDMLAIMGEKNGKVLAGAARFIILYKAGKLLRGDRVALSLVCDFVANNPGLRDSAKLVISGGNGIVSPQLASGLHYLMAKKDKDGADMLFHGLKRGFELPLDHPFVTLRERLIANATSTAKLPMAAMAAYCIKAWNAHRDGNKIRIFRFIQDESFPKIA